MNVSNLHFLLAVDIRYVCNEVVRHWTECIQVVHPGFLQQDDSLANFCLFEDRWQLQASCLGFLLVGGTVGGIIRLCKFELVI
jgi:hypothetical protein